MKKLISIFLCLILMGCSAGGAEKNKVAEVEKTSTKIETTVAKKEESIQTKAAPSTTTPETKPVVTTTPATKPVVTTTPGTKPVATTTPSTTAAEKVTTVVPAETSSKPVESKKQLYILNTSTGKFHRTGCSSIRKMKESNKKEETNTREAIIEKGYDPCKICYP